MPVHRAGVASVQSAVRADLVERERVGVERYGTPLQPFNQRNALRDAYEEALDLACYLKQALIEEELRGIDGAGNDNTRRGAAGDHTGAGATGQPVAGRGDQPGVLGLVPGPFRS